MRTSSDAVPPDGNEGLEGAREPRRVEITVEREVMSVSYEPASGVTGWCEGCRRDVLLLTAEAAAMTTGISARELYRRLDENRIHFREFPSGAVLICSESLKTLPSKELP